MTIYDLSQSYRASAAKLRMRIMELEQKKRVETSPRRVQELDGRIRSLRPLYRDTQRVAKYLENYYRK